MINFNTKLMFTLCVFFVLNNINAQKFASTEEEYDSIYALNIQMSNLKGVYIPKNLAEAHSRIIKLSPSKSLANFNLEDEEEVCRKLHFGIGRWMIINWNFYGGSRLSHYLKSEGLLHPDDMAQYILRTLHRKLNNLPLNEKTIIDQLAEMRKKEVDRVYKN